METELPLLHSGKVRRLYAWPRSEGETPKLLMVATDNISAFDHVLDSTIPDKGKILTQLSLWWLKQLGVDNHVVSTEVPECLVGRAMVTEELTMIPVECVARGYLTGSGWAEYQKTGTVCGIELPPGLMDGSRLPEPIFTPAIKAAVGEHDENVDFATIVRLHGDLLAAALRDLTIYLYRRAESIARSRGIILADTKFEFGARRDGSLVLADEVLTPDSSRFWDAELWKPGGSQPSFDKQIVRDYLAKESGWDPSSDTPPPPLPPEIIAATQRRYLEAYERLTGSPFAGYDSVIVRATISSSAIAESVPAGLEDTLPRQVISVTRPPMPTPPPVPVMVRDEVVATPVVAAESVAVESLVGGTVEAIRPPMPTPPPVPSIIREELKRDEFSSQQVSDQQIVPVLRPQVGVPAPMPTPPPVPVIVRKEVGETPVTAVESSVAEAVAGGTVDAVRPPMPTPLPVPVIGRERAGKTIEMSVRQETSQICRVIVDVMPKPEILDPQGKAITGALKRLGFTDMSVRQGKRFEIEVPSPITEETLAQITDAAEKLLANTVIETFAIREIK